ncbi:IucA/IucC family protein [Cronobacter sakazakii]|uniref:IucA/IucC family protein n=1 Tax=Cronobacter sakazakii TaxID=28141 RepID=UPI003D07CA9D
MVSLPRPAATDVAAQCFLNALLRETRDWQLIPGALPQEPAQIHLPLSETQAIRIALRYFSPTQHHQYLFPAMLVGRDNDSCEPVDFTKLVDLVLAKPSVKGELTDDVLARFARRVQESHRHTWQAIELRHDLATLRAQPLNFAEAEQALLVGHAFHPAPKSHEPFNETEARRYLPDFAPRFPLRWFAVNKAYVAGESLGLDLRTRLLRFAAQSAPALLEHFTDTRWLVPMHPWQAEYLLAQPWCQALVEKGELTDLGEAGAPWLPTSSSRSLYSETNNDMIKFSLSVRLTNSVRTLSVKEVKRGMRLARMAQTPRWQALQAYCERILLPLFSAEADYGLVLLAHQQNILVEMQQDLPVGLIYRDCQGSGFTDGALLWLAEAGEPDAENRFSEAQLLRYFPYYLLVNSTLAVTAALGAAGFEREEKLMALVRDALAQLRATARDTRCLDYVLESRHWNCKGNFFCYLHDHNENTIADPAVIYFNFDNPFAGSTHDA